jgi:hypothetical protein
MRNKSLQITRKKASHGAGHAAILQGVLHQVCDLTFVNLRARPRIMQ